MDNYELGQMIGKFTGQILVAVIIIYLLYKFIRKNWNK